MAPRNNDTNPNYTHKKNFSNENNAEVDIKNLVPCLLHKKHKVVKLVRSQLQKIHEEGLEGNIQGSDTDIYYVDGESGKRFKRSMADRSSPPGTSKDREKTSGRRGRDNGALGDIDGICLCFYVLLILLLIFLFLLLVVWISTGPLSNSSAHTPIPPGSFVRTDGLCSLEKKYLLRWSKPEYFE